MKSTQLALAAVILVSTALIAPPDTTLAQGDDGALIETVANEAARALGWSGYDQWMDEIRATITLSQPSGVVCDENFGREGMEEIWIWNYGDAGTASHRFSWETEFHGYPATTEDWMAPDQMLTWRMGRFILSAKHRECPLDDFMENAEALYAAAAAHHLGEETPAAEATPTPSPEPLLGYTLQGTVTDGHQNPVRYAPVRLTYGENEQSTVTDGFGRYQFGDLPNSPVAGFNPAEDAYRVTVQLQYAPEGGVPLYRVIYGSESGSLVAPVSKAFSLPDKPGLVNYDVDFGKPAQFQTNLLDTIDPKLAGRLDDLAAIYVHLSQAVDMADLLGQEISRPFDTVVFVHGQSGACWYGRNSNGTQDWNNCLYLSNQKYAIGLGEQESEYIDWGRPMNREWHEFGHHFMADSFGGVMPSYQGRQNHMGYYINTRSTDSWTEGFAEFFAMMTARHITDDPDFIFYPYGTTSKIPIELNYMTWADEEFATAGLLLDLVDNDEDYPPRASAAGGIKRIIEDDDAISIPVEDLWQIIVSGASAEADGNGHIFDMVDLYKNLAAQGVGTDDGNQNGRPDLNDVFIDHGFFEDLDGDMKYTDGDRIGYSSHASYKAKNGYTYPAMSDRRDAPDLPGAYVATTILDEQGQAVNGAGFQVDILLVPPYNYYDLSYTVPANAVQNGRLYFLAPPDGYPSKIQISAVGEGYEGSEALEISGAEFWAKQPDPDDQPLQSHSFMLKSEKASIPPFAQLGLGSLCCLGGLGLAVIGIVLQRKSGGGSRRTGYPPTPGQAPQSARTPIGKRLLLTVLIVLAIMAVAVGLFNSESLPGLLATQATVTAQMLSTETYTAPAAAATTELELPMAPPLEEPSMPQGDNILFEDDFSDPESGWSQSGTEEGLYEYTLGGYRIFVNETDSEHRADAGLDLEDVRIEVEATQMGGPDDNDHGLFCRASDDDGGSYIFFEISSEGAAIIGWTAGDEREALWSELVQPAGIILHGPDANHLRADCIGETLSFYVNGTLVATATDPAPAGGDVGLVAGTWSTAGTDILFDNFVVMKP